MSTDALVVLVGVGIIVLVCAVLAAWSLLVDGPRFRLAQQRQREALEAAVRVVNDQCQYEYHEDANELRRRMAGAALTGCMQGMNYPNSTSNELFDACCKISGASPEELTAACRAVYATLEGIRVEATLAECASTS